MTTVYAPAAGRSQRRTLLAGLGCLVLVVVLLLVYQLWLSYQEEIRDGETATRNYAAIFQTRLDATLRRTDAILKALTRSIPARALDRQVSTGYIAEVSAELDSRLLDFDELVGLRVFDANADLLFSSDWANTPRFNVADRDYFLNLREHPQAEPAFSEVIVSRATGRPSLIVARAAGRSRYLSRHGQRGV